MKTIRRVVKKRGGRWVWKEEASRHSTVGKYSGFSCDHRAAGAVNVSLAQKTRAGADARYFSLLNKSRPFFFPLFFPNPQNHFTPPSNPLFFSSLFYRWKIFCLLRYSQPSLISTVLRAPKPECLPPLSFFKSFFPPFYFNVYIYTWSGFLFVLWFILLLRANLSPTSFHRFGSLFVSSFVVFSFFPLFQLFKMTRVKYE